MLEPFSQLEVAFRDTLLTKATGVSLDRLGALYGFPRLSIFDRKYYRRALREVALGRRGTYRCLFKALEHLFGQYTDLKSTYNVTLDPATPHALTYREGNSPPFDCASTGRFVRIKSPTFGSKIYYSQNLVDGVLQLNPIDTPCVAGADWSTLAAAEDATASLLGFMLRETNPGPSAVDGENPEGDPWHPEGYKEENTCTVSLFVDNTIWNVPATYLQDQATDARSVTAPNQPFGGHLMSLYDAANLGVVSYPGSGVADEVHVESGDIHKGPYPIYLGAEGSAAPSFVSLIDGILAAGVHLTVETFDWCAGSAFPVFNPHAPDFDIGEGPQLLPPFWDLGVHGVPPQERPAQIEMAAQDTEFFIFHDALNVGAYVPDIANLIIGPTGKVLLDSDTLYELQPPLQITPANGYLLTATGTGLLTGSDGVLTSQLSVATFTVDGEDASANLAAGVDPVVKTETAGSGTPTLYAPGSVNITGVLPRDLDFFGKGIAGYFKLTDGASDYWSQSVRVVLDGNRNLATTTGLSMTPAISITAGVDVIRISHEGEIFEDVGAGEVSLGHLNVGIFPNPKGLFEVADADDLYQETDALNQAVVHRRSGSPTVGALPNTAPRGRLSVNSNVGGMMIRLDSEDNVLRIRRGW